MITNWELDEEVFRLIQTREATRNMSLGGTLLRRYSTKLQQVIKSYPNGGSSRIGEAFNHYWNACELANRACKRLRAAGRITFNKHSKTWRANDARRTDPTPA